MILLTDFWSVLLRRRLLQNQESRLAGRHWGYARISDDAQSLNLQFDALRAAGIEDKMVFADQASGTRTDREGLARLLAQSERGDTITVWRLDRLGRSVAHLSGLLEELQQREIGFRSLTEAIDTKTPSGRMIFAIMASLAAYERELIVERVRAGMRAAALRGAHLGRPRSLTRPQRMHAAKMRADGFSYKQIAAVFRVHPSTIYRSITA